MLKRVKNGQREKIMGPGTSMGSKEYKKVGLVGNVAMEKKFDFLSTRKKSQVSRSFFLAKICPAN